VIGEGQAALAAEKAARSSMLSGLFSMLDGEEGR
jgi:hypothetical protein